MIRAATCLGLLNEFEDVRLFVEKLQDGLDNRFQLGNRFEVALRRCVNALAESGRCRLALSSAR